MGTNAERSRRWYKQVRGVPALVSVLLLAVALASAQRRDAGDMLARIRAEGLQRSRALTCTAR